MKNLLVVGSLCLASTVIAGPGVPNINGGGSSSGGGNTNALTSSQNYLLTNAVQGVSGFGTNSSMFVQTNASISYTYQTNSLVYNVMDWGATCSGSNYNGVKVVTGSTTLTVTNGQFNAGDVGKFICVQFAGGTNGVGGLSDLTTFISAVGSATSITLSNAAVLGVTNSSLRYGWDDTVAAQALLNYICTNGGGTFFIPRPMVIAGPLQDVSNNWTNHHNSQLIAPPLSPNGSAVVDICFAGPRAAGSAQQGTATTNNPAMSASAVGGAIWSFLPFAPTAEHGAVIDFRNFVSPIVDSGPPGGYLVPMNNIKASTLNLTWWDCWDSNKKLCNFEGANQSYVGNCFFTLGFGNANVAGIPVTMPNTVAVAMSGYFNNNNALMENSFIGSGFYNGVYAFDNLNINNVTALWCINGVTMPNDAAGIVYFSNDSFQECSNFIYSTFGGHVKGNVMLANYQQTNPHDIVDVLGGGVEGVIQAQDLGAYAHASVGGVGVMTYLSAPSGTEVVASQQQQFFRNGYNVAQNFGLRAGADSGGSTLTPNTNKKFDLAFPLYDPQNWAVPLIDFQSGSGYTIMELGGDSGYAYNYGTNHGGATAIRFNTSSSTTAGSIATVGAFDNSGNFYFTGIESGNGSGLTNIPSATNATYTVLATNVVSGISITNAFITNSVFAGNAGGVTNINADANGLLGTNGFSFLSLPWTNGVPLTSMATNLVVINGTNASLTVATSGFYQINAAFSIIESNLTTAATSGYILGFLAKTNTTSTNILFTYWCPRASQDSGGPYVLATPVMTTWAQLTAGDSVQVWFGSSRAISVGGFVPYSLFFSMSRLHP